MNMLIYHRAKPFPKCRVCGDRMRYWVSGLSDANHAHAVCAGRDAADRSMRKVLAKGNERCLKAA